MSQRLVEPKTQRGSTRKKWQPDDRPRKATIKKTSIQKSGPPTRAPRRNFDRDSGQTYLETEVVFRSKGALNWVREPKTPSIIRPPSSREIGPRTLLEMARSKVTREILDLAAEHFEYVPWSVADGLWTEITDRHLESFYAWRLLAMAYQSNDEFGAPAKRYHLEIKQPPLQMKDYYASLNSTSQDWHVALRLSPKQNSIPDLVAVSDIANLAVLDLSDGQLRLDARPPPFDERVFRTWAELAAARKAFTQLRVLLFGWQDNLSEWIFSYLGHFPSLRLVLITDCPELHQKNRAQWEPTANDLGWTAYHAKKSAKTLRPLLEDRSFALGAVSNLYYLPGNGGHDGDAKVRSDQSVRPLAECWLGTPRLWTHIIDEFPGSRTVWLDRVETTHMPLLPAPKLVKRAREVGHLTESSPLPPYKRPPKRSIKTSKSIHRPEYNIANLLEELER